MDRLLELTALAERSHFWFRGFRWFLHPVLARAVAGRARARILDCGCGTGSNLAMLDPFGETYGFDLTWRGLLFAHEHGRRRIAQGSIDAIPFKTGSFDLVTSFDVLSTLDDAMEQRALAEIRRVLRPGGALIVNTAALRFLHGQHAVFASEVRRLSRGQLRASLERSGFRISRLTYTNFSLLPLMIPVRAAQRLMGLSTPEETGADISTPAAPVNAALSALLAAEAFALKFVNMPLGSSLLALARAGDRP